MKNGCQYSYCSRYASLFAFASLFLFPLVGHSATGHRLAGTEVCYPLSYELYQYATKCTGPNGTSPTRASEEFRLSSPTQCQTRYWTQAGCTGSVRWPINGGWANTSGCSDLKDLVANPETCELQQPDCSMRFGEATVINLPRTPRNSAGQTVCYDYCKYKIETLFNWNTEYDMYDAAFVIPVEDTENCYPLPPTFDPVIPEEDQIPDQPEPGFPYDPLPAPTYNITPDSTHINGQNITEYPSSGCSLLSGGAYLCAAGDKPPTGKDGQKTHQKTGGIQKGDGTEYDYYSPLPSTGLPGTGQGPGGSVKDTSGGATYGGDDCKTPPVCTGNEIQCAILRQQWLTRCPPAGTIGTDGLFDTTAVEAAAKNKLREKLGIENITIEEILDWSPDASQNYFCPDPITMNTPSWGSVEWKFDPLCSMAERVRGYFLLLVRLVAILIFIRAAKG